MGDFVVDSNGRCFLCLGRGHHEPFSNSPSKRRPLSPGKRDQMSASEAYSLRCLFRYLEMDRSGERSKIIFLCGSCAPICNIFSELYQQRELIDMKVSSYLKLIHGELTNAEELDMAEKSRESDTLQQSNEGLPAGKDTMEGLRNEVFQSCSQKLTVLLPRVNVRRMSPEDIINQTLRLNHASMEDEATEGTIIKLEVPFDDDSHFEDLSPSHDPDLWVGTDGSGSQEDHLKTKTVSKRRRPSKPKGKVRSQKSSQKKARKPGGGKPRTTPWTLNPETGHYTCTLCSEEFSAYFKFYKHHDVVHNNTKYKCDLCSKEFPYKVAYKIHLRRVHKLRRAVASSSTLRCEKCSAVFSNKYNLNHHQINIKCSDQDYPTWKVKYDVGGKHRKEILRRKRPQLTDDWKLQSTVDPDTGRFSCLHCPKDFKSLKTFQDHYSGVHLKLKYKCGLCPKEFPYRSTYHEHMMEAHRRGRFQCPKCDKLFTRIGLVQHQRWRALRGHCDRNRDRVSTPNDVEVKKEPNVIPEGDDDGTEVDCDDGETENTTEFAGVKTEEEENIFMGQTPTPTEGRSVKVKERQSHFTTEDPNISLDNEQDSVSMSTDNFNEDFDKSDDSQIESDEDEEDKDEEYLPATKKSHQAVTRSSRRSKRTNTRISPVDDDMSQEDRNASMDDVDGNSDDSYHPPVSPQKSDNESKHERTTDLSVKKKKRSPRKSIVQASEAEELQEAAGDKAPSQTYRKRWFIEESHRIKNPDTGKVRCALCPNKGEVTQASFRAHYRFAHLNRKFTCTHCGNSYRCQPDLIAHTNRMHKAQGLNNDLTTAETEFQPEGSTEVGDKREPPNTEVLPLQSVTTTRKRFIGDEHLIRTQKTGKVVRCALCPNGRDYPQSDAFREHYKKVHLNHRYRCTVCEKSYLYRGSLMVHFNRVHKAEGNFPCEKCGKVYSVKHDLTRHLTLSKYCGSRERATWLCNTCGRSLSSKDNLIRHVRTVHEGLKIEPKTRKEKPKGPTTDLIPDEETGTFRLDAAESVEVDVVGPPDLNKRDVGEFVVLKSAVDEPDVGTYSYQEVYPPNVPHGAVPPEPVVDPETGKFKCKDCPMEFRTAIIYRNHYKGVHWKVKFKCNLCNKQFTQVASCHSHHRLQHQHVRVKCPVCQGLLRDRAGLNKHLRKTGCGKGRKPKPKREVDQFCHICGLGIRGVKYLMWHVKHIHSDVKGKLCEVCGKGFKTNQQLKRHLETMHPEHSKEVTATSSSKVIEPDK